MAKISNGTVKWGWGWGRQKQQQWWQWWQEQRRQQWPNTISVAHKEKLQKILLVVIIFLTRIFTDPVSRN